MAADDRVGPDHDDETAGRPAHVRAPFLGGSDSDGGRIVRPHSEGCGPSSRCSLPPAWMSDARRCAASNGFPFSRADRTYCGGGTSDRPSELIGVSRCPLVSMTKSRSPAWRVAWLKAGALIRNRFCPATGNSPSEAHTDRKSTRLNSSHVEISYAV